MTAARHETRDNKCGAARNRVSYKRRRRRRFGLRRATPANRSAGQRTAESADRRYPHSPFVSRRRKTLRSIPVGHVRSAAVRCDRVTFAPLCPAKTWRRYDDQTNALHPAQTTPFVRRLSGRRWAKTKNKIRREREPRRQHKHNTRKITRTHARTR